MKRDNRTPAQTIGHFMLPNGETLDIPMAIDIYHNGKIESVVHLRLISVDIETEMDTIHVEPFECIPYPTVDFTATVVNHAKEKVER
jgi:hypothetical protein